MPLKSVLCCNTHSVIHTTLLFEECSVKQVFWFSFVFSFWVYFLFLQATFVTLNIDVAGVTQGYELKFFLLLFVSARFFWLFASECREWLIHFSLPVLYGQLNPEAFVHYTLLVTAMALLTKEGVQACEIDYAEKLLTDFCRIYPAIYGKLKLLCCRLYFAFLWKQYFYNLSERMIST